jgi:hypothetical protein
LTPYEDYRVQFQMLAELNGWTEKVKALYLAGCLSKGARSVLNDMIPAERYVYEKLDGALRGRYGTDDQAELFKAKLRSRIKSKDESLQELAHDIRRLVRLAYPKAAMQTHDDLTKDQFIESLGDGEIRWSVFQARPQNLNEALKVAMELEAFRESEKCRMRKSVRGVHLEEAKLGKEEVEAVAVDTGEGVVAKLESSLQQIVMQINQLRQGNNGAYGNKGAPGDGRREAGGSSDHPGGMRSDERMVPANSREGNGWNQAGSFGARRPFDVGRVRCFRCDKLGHFVRDCPDLPKRGSMADEKVPLNG